MSHILCVQDLSCVGKCSLTVALPVLSAMGHRCSVLPTAVLSTHTAFPDPRVVDMSDEMAAFADHWLAQGVTFDSICAGYLGNPSQAEEVLRIKEQFACPLILDPVMGDHGKLYKRITPAHIDAMQKLCAQAEVVLPNVTEAAYLTQTPYRELFDRETLQNMAKKLLALGAKAAVITGVRWEDGQFGWYSFDGRESHCHKAEFIPKAFHGTGDLFAAVFAGSFLAEKDIPAAAVKAAAFVRACIQNTPAYTPFGVDFEKCLPLLMK